MILFPDLPDLLIEHVVVLSISSFACAASSAKRVPARRRCSSNGSPSFVALMQERTIRLQEALCQLGRRRGGQAGADVGSELGISGSRDTILRLVRGSKQSATSEPRIIGLDDWARKRRLRYGTLICDLERSQPLDLLAVKRDYFCIQTAHHLNKERLAWRGYSDGTVVFSSMRMRSHGPSYVTGTFLK